MDIKGLGSYAIHFDGPRLSMNDKRVFEAVARLAKASSHDLNEMLDTSLREIAVRMGWSATGGRSLTWVWDSLVRLNESSIEFRLPDGIPREGRLIESATKSPRGVHIRFDPGFILPAFGIDKQFKINTDRRATLTSPLAQWLHDFISTHSTAYPLTFAPLRELCGFEARSRAFPKRLADASAVLCAASPELVANVEQVKSSRSSDLWEIQFTRGTEPADFFDPTRPAKRFSSPVSIKPKTARQQGLSL